MGEAGGQALAAWRLRSRDASAFGAACRAGTPGAAAGGVSVQVLARAHRLPPTRPPLILPAPRPAAHAPQFERTLIVAEEGAYVSYLEGCTAPAYDENQLHAAVVELSAAKDAEIKYSTVQNWCAPRRDAPPRAVPPRPPAAHAPASGRGPSLRAPSPQPPPCATCLCSALLPLLSCRCRLAGAGTRAMPRGAAASTTL